MSQYEINQIETWNEVLRTKEGFKYYANKYGIIRMRYSKGIKELAEYFGRTVKTYTIQSKILDPYRMEITW